MLMRNTQSTANRARYEMLPFASAEEAAAQLAEPAWLTVTCSPKHGPDRSVEVGARMRALGHDVTVHIAAKMVRDAQHLTLLLEAMAAAGIRDLFLVAGDADVAGEYASALELLPVIAAHPRRPATIGITGYPEGHPQIAASTLASALAEKAPDADYIATQLCFDPAVLRRWILSVRDQGITLPIWVGMPGQVNPKRLLEISMQIGVGRSMSFLRKQRGLRNILGMSGALGASSAAALRGAIAPTMGDAALNVAGFHYFTFNKLVETWEWEQAMNASACAEAVEA
jgi:methylenetetrahydrofolate reductase (NADPH)